FEDARTLAEQLIARHEGHLYNYGTLVDALVELGEYEKAVEVCDKMLSLRPDLASYARASYLRQLHGDTDGAIEAMRMAADAGATGSEGRAWALYQLGNLYLNANKPDTAAFLFNGILEEAPGYTRALSGLAHVHLVEGEHAEAIALLDEAYAEAPNTGFLELLAEADQATGDAQKLASTVKKIRKSYRAAEKMGENVDMEYADFLADQDTDLDEALRRARKAYERRPDHLHALETYAWVLYKNDRAAEAVPYVERAMRLGTGDAMVHYRAGMIYHAAGQAAEAATQFERALAAHLHIESRTAADEAREMLAGLL
ncbi:MAG: tetratricopeptide repeat protein, partial [Rhodothermales bacterium]